MATREKENWFAIRSSYSSDLARIFVNRFPNKLLFFFGGGGGVPVPTYQLLS